MAELADASLPLVPDANHPAFPTRSQVDDWEIKRPAILDSAEEMAVIGQRCAQAKPSKELREAKRSAEKNKSKSISMEKYKEIKTGNGDKTKTNPRD